MKLDITLEGHQAFATTMKAMEQRKINLHEEGARLASQGRSENVLGL